MKYIIRNNSTDSVILLPEHPDVISITLDSVNPHQLEMIRERLSKLFDLKPELFFSSFIAKTCFDESKNRFLQVMLYLVLLFQFKFFNVKHKRLIDLLTYEHCSVIGELQNTITEIFKDKEQRKGNVNLTKHYDCITKLFSVSI